MNNNVYKVCSNGIICADLLSAVTECVRQMEHENNLSENKEYRAYYESPNKLKINRLSAPIVTKRQGGYKVICIGTNGCTYYREIDMFKPLHKVNTTISFIHHT